ncbi:dipeptidyl peptidase IV [Geofilum rubicundum JCM 15548]|uniref:Dipeptidyl peptidase IV n=2 Tax=Geofilum TaxID=1236988 RepID=A0A0E9LUM1_9BACT|nr:dipeptidyl peptidase IV [Geofilum rubicundum JCM 15548]
MRIWLLFLLVALALSATAQNKKAELADFVTKGTFTAKGIEKMKPMKDGAHYTVLEAGGQKVVKYAYDSKKPVAVLVDIPQLKQSTIESIKDYEFSGDETKLLVYTNRKNIYRRSFTADYYVVDITRKEIEPLSDKSPQQAAAFAPDGYSVAFVRNNNLFIKNLRFKTEAAITSDGARDTIINGVPDWVYEEEFAFNRAFEWSPNSAEIAYIKFDEREVDQFQFPLYQASHPALDQHELYPGAYRYKYPKAGQKNSRVSVHVFNIRHRTTKKMDVPGEDIYIPRIQWTTNPEQLSIVTLNRRQDQLNLYLAKSSSGVARSVLTDRNSQYISSEVLDHIIFLEDGAHFAYVAELDGYNHIHLYGMDGIKKNQVTKGEWDVTEYYGFDARNKLFYFQAAAVSPLQREVYSVRMDGSRLTRLTPQDGTNKAWFSKDFSYYIIEYNSVETPSVYTVYDSRGRQQQVLEDNQVLVERVNAHALPKKEFFSFETETGVKLNGYIIKPLQMEASKSYPLLMTQYSGPNSQQVLDKWGKSWEHYLALQGYVVACVDGRGTGARGEAFRKQTYMQLGKLESDDQIDAARYLGALDYVDADRIGIYGWSYGGFMTSLVMSRSDLFKAGIAVAPVTHWKFYDTAYTERFMRMPRENPKGYDQNSPINLADDLHGRLFLIHGTADDNVHVQNVMEYADRLVQAGKQFDMFIYPNRDHGLRGGNGRMHLYQMKLDFLDRHLK